MNKKKATELKEVQATKTTILRAQVAIDKFINETPKAKLKSMKRIISEFDGLPTQITDESGTLQFDTIGKLITIGMQQIDPTLTDEEAEDVIDMDNIQAAIQATTHFMTMRVPDSVIPPEMSEAAEEETEGDEKNAT